MMSAHKLLTGGSLLSNGGSSGGTTTASSVDTFTANTITFATSINSIPAANFAHLSGATSNLQTQITAKANSASPTFTGTTSTDALTANTITFATSINSIPAANFANLSGATSNLQTQITAKANSASPTFTGIINFNGGVNLNSITNISSLYSVVESISMPTFATSISHQYPTNPNINYIASVSAPITTFLITNLPTTAQKSYTITYILSTISGANYITASTLFRINGSTTVFANGISGLAPTAYIVQTIVVVNISTTDGSPNWKVFFTAFAV